MIGKKSAIRKYKKKLAPELSRRYGGNGPYTEAQVKTAVNDLGLKHRFIHFAYLMYCSQAELARQGIDDASANDMHATIEKATAASIFTAPLNVIFGSGDDGGSLGDGGSGSDGGI